MSSMPGGIDGLEVRFDDGSLVADAGLVLAGTVMERLGLEALIDEAVRPPQAGRGSGAKALSMVASMLVSGSFVDDAERLRAGSAGAVLPFEPLAPSTLGTWLRSFTWGHVRQFDRACELALARAWSAGAAPAVAEMTVDLDSTVCEVCGKSKHGAAYGHTKVLSYHPVVAVRDDTGEMIHTRMRSGSSQRGHLRFVSETLARLGRLAPEAAVTVRADAGFFSYDMIERLDAHNARYSITIAQNSKVTAAIDAIDDKAWKPIAYTEDGTAQVAETTITTGRRDDKGPRKLRLVVRRTRIEGPQATLWPDWRRHCFVTDRDDLDTEAAHDLPPRPRQSRARHQRPQSQRPRPQPLGQVRRQRRPPRLRRFGPQHRPLDRPHRTSPPPQSAHRSRHRPPAAAHNPRPRRQPQPTTHPAHALPLALGPHLHPRPRTHPQPAPDHLSTRPGTRRTPEHTPAPPTRHSPKPQPSAPPHAQKPPDLSRATNQSHNHHRHQPTGGFRLSARG